jgi:TPR repeat protein
MPTDTGTPSSAPHPYCAFISYSRADAAPAQKVCAALESSGLRCWIAPRDLMPGREWGEEIIHAIDSSRVMVLVFSSHANASPQVRREVERAIAKGCPIVPLRVEEVLPTGSMEYSLYNTHWLDAFEAPLDKHMKTLMAVVKTIGADRSSPATQAAFHPPSNVPQAAQVPAAPPALPSAGRGPAKFIAVLLLLIVVATLSPLLYRRFAPATTGEYTSNTQQPRDAARAPSAPPSASAVAAPIASPSTAPAAILSAPLSAAPAPAPSVAPSTSPAPVSSTPLSDAELIDLKQDYADYLTARNVDLTTKTFTHDRGTVRWEAWRRAALADQPTGDLLLALCYQEGVGVPQDYAEAMTWYRKAADVGNAPAMWRIGMLFAHGQGVSSDFAEAMKWYRKAADSGDSVAMRMLGLLFEIGTDVPQDYAEAMRWYRKAADVGDARAMRYIAECFEDGSGVAKDRAQAVTWYEKAAAAGDKDASDWLARNRQ